MSDNVTPFIVKGIEYIPAAINWKWVMAGYGLMFLLAIALFIFAIIIIYRGRKKMSMRLQIKDWLQIVLLFMLIIAASGFVIWMGISVYGNLTEKGLSDLPKMPSESKAEYAVIVQTTGDILLTNKYDVQASEHEGFRVYTLNGFYRVYDDKWKWSDNDFTLDEYIWGKITVNKRSGT